MKTIFSTLLLASLTALGAHTPQSNDALSASYKNWYINHPNGEYEPGNMPLQPLRTTEGWIFSFPLGTPISPNHVDYVQTWLYGPTAVAELAAATAISMTFTVQVMSGTPVFDWQTASDNTCSYPVHVRFILEQYLTWLDSGYDRWWSDEAAVEINATTGTVTLTASLDPSQWSSVYGEVGDSSLTALDGFEGCKANIGMLGFTFGGGCFYGHGCFIQFGSGTANFVLTNFKLE